MMKRKWQRILLLSQLSREKLVEKKEHSKEEKSKKEWIEKTK